MRSHPSPKWEPGEESELFSLAVHSGIGVCHLQEPPAPSHTAPGIISLRSGGETLEQYHLHFQVRKRGPESLLASWRHGIRALGTGQWWADPLSGPRASVAKAGGTDQNGHWNPRQPVAGRTGTVPGGGGARTPLSAPRGAGAGERLGGPLAGRQRGAGSQLARVDPAQGAGRRAPACCFSTGEVFNYF